jgi:hypothetical protein
VLMSPLRSTNISIVDINKNFVKTWTSNYGAVNAAYLLEDGSILRGGKVRKNPAQCQFLAADGSGGIVERINWNNNVVWSYELGDNDYCLHHDIELLPNGNVLMIVVESITYSEALAAGRNPSILHENGLWADKIIEVDPTNNQIVWEWRSLDHLIQDYDSNQDNYGVVANNPQLININYVRYSTIRDPEWHHSNAIAYNSEYNQIILSVHGFDEFWIIDHSTTTAGAASHSGGTYGKGGDLLYRFGNPAAYNTSGEQKFYGQHDVHWIPSGRPGAGNILVFNNGRGRPRGSEYTKVEEIQRNFPYSQVWTYQAPTPTDFYAANISGAQRLSNGNTLICDGPDGYVFEVTNDGTIVWFYQNPDADYTALFRAYKYPPEYPGLSQLDIVPVEFGIFEGCLIPTDGSVVLTWTILSQSNNYGFEVERYINSDWKKIGFVKGNGTSANAISYQLTDKLNDEKNVSAIQYRLKQVDNDGSFSYSDVITVQITKPAKFSLFQNYPNPFNPNTTISFSLPSANKVSLKIYDLCGKQVAELVNGQLNAGIHCVEWQVKNLPSGIYFYILKSGSFSETKRMVLLK